MAFLTPVCLGAAVLLVFLIMVAFIRRFERRDRPPGSYKSPDYYSGGSIGRKRGGRAHDSPDFDSGGTIGGDRSRRAHDDPDIDSGASIGGGPSVGQSPRAGRSGKPTGSRQLGGASSADERPRPYETGKDRGRIDTPDIESGGSFGG